MKNDSYPPHGREAPRKPLTPTSFKDHEREVLEGAEYHVATEFLGGGRYVLKKRKSRKAAEVEARRIIEKRDPKNLFSIGRPVLIYAVRGVHQVVAGTVFPPRVSISKRR